MKFLTRSRRVEFPPAAGANVDVSSKVWAMLQAVSTGGRVTRLDHICVYITNVIQHLQLHTNSKYINLLNILVRLKHN